jgi:hypothetical protein
MTIFETMRQKLLEKAQTKLNKLIEVNAPEVLIEMYKKPVDKLLKQTPENTKNGLIANIELISIKEFKGKGGKPYYICNDSIVCFTNWGLGFKLKEY